MVSIRIDAPEEMAVVVEKVLTAFKKHSFDHAHVVALHGDLGVGKTTFTQYLAKALGVSDVVNSPTFTIMKGYETSSEAYQTLVHMDVYRIDTQEEMEPLHFSELLAQANTLVCIEWAERIKKLLPPDTVHVRFAHIDKSRVITIEHGE